MREQWIPGPFLQFLEWVWGHTIIQLDSYSSETMVGCKGQAGDCFRNVSETCVRTINCPLLPQTSFYNEATSPFTVPVRNSLF